MDEASLPYLNAFPPAAEADWRSRVETVLKGKSASSLAGKTYDGITVEPLYPSSDALPVLRPERGWAIVQRVDMSDPAAANAQALEDLGNGADGLQLVVAGSLGANGTGMPADTSLEAILSGVVIDAEIPVEIDSLDDGSFADRLADLVASSKADPSATRIAFGIDPFGRQARGGPAADEKAIGARVRNFITAGFAGPFLVADARLIHAAGGSEAQELGYAVAAGLAGLRILEAAGIPLEQARSLVSFRMAVDADEFLGVAKLRALRRLWTSVEEQCGLSPAPAHVHAETAWRMMTRRDPDVNMLRATLAVFAAAIGGADRITVLPHTQALGLPDAFARRVARNTQLVLREEANLDKVSDPAAGSGGFEALTGSLCEKGWDVFRSIESAGGLANALSGNSFRSAVAEVAASRAKNVARRKDGITGVSEFPAFGEASPAPAPMPVEAPFAPHRLAEPFEALRDRSDDLLARTGARPKVYLAKLGSVAASTPRATFAKNLFEAGGFEPVSHDGGDTPDSHADSFRKTGAVAACLCSSDAIYAEKAETTARALAAAGAKRVILAGRPGEDEARLRAAGITDFAFAGGDVLGLLQSLAKH